MPIAEYRIEPTQNDSSIDPNVQLGRGNINKTWINSETVQEYHDSTLEGQVQSEN